MQESCDVAASSPALNEETSFDSNGIEFVNVKQESAVKLEKQDEQVDTSSWSVAQEQVILNTRGM